MCLNEFERIIIIYLSNKNLGTEQVTSKEELRMSSHPI